jgi:nitronate monooxygenase
MGGGLVGPELAAAVAAAGGLGTLGLLPPTELGEATANCVAPPPTTQWRSTC